jgi:hypothetical protein
MSDGVPDGHPQESQPQLGQDVQHGFVGVQTIIEG